MSKQDNLHDFLVDIADAVREKKGTTEHINAQSLSDEIRSIDSGGGKIYSYDETMFDINGGGYYQTKTVNIVAGVTTISTRAYYSASGIESVNIPDSVNNINSMAFYGCIALKQIIFPRLVSSINTSVCYNCAVMTHAYIMGNITNVYPNSFSSCKKMVACVFSGNTSVPTLSNVNAFNSNTCLIIVPDNLYDEWIAATNWSTYADRIVKASEYQPNNE